MNKHYHVVWYADGDIFCHTIYYERESAIFDATSIPASMYFRGDMNIIDKHAELMMKLKDEPDNELEYLLVPKAFATNVFISACTESCQASPTSS